MNFSHPNLNNFTFLIPTDLSGVFTGDPLVLALSCTRKLNWCMLIDLKCLVKTLVSLHTRSKTVQMKGCSITRLANWFPALFYLTKDDLLRHPAILKSNQMLHHRRQCFRTMDSMLGMTDLSRTTVSGVEDYYGIFINDRRHF